MASEFFMLTSLILVGIIFFVVFQTYLSTQYTQTKESEIRADAELITSLIYKISKDPSQYFYYCLNIPLSNVTIENGLMKYESRGFKFNFLVPKEVENVEIIETTKLCFEKRGNRVSLSIEAIECNFDSFCELYECKASCLDCYGPNKICQNDNFCNINIGENCKNSMDCSCNNFGYNYICCPENPSSNKYGCLYLPNKKKKGEECYCDSECGANLKCNPVAPSFTSYKKACCDEGKSWNGSECILGEVECKYPCVPGCKLPKKWDWRNVNGINYLNPVRDQGLCGACWAFSTIGAVEGVYNVENNCPACNKDLSEQHLISDEGICCSDCGNCKGGSPHLALSYIHSIGVCDEGCFPYKERNYPCNLCSDYSKRLWKIESFGLISNNLDEIKRAVICYGPLSVGSVNWKHTIVLVGYDDERGVWIIRNSWGTSWGDRGYGYIPYTGHPYSDLIDYVWYVKGVRGS